MKKLLLGLLFMTSLCAQAQKKVVEPEVIGEAFIMKSDNSILPLDKQTIEFRTSAGVDVGLISVARTKKKIQVEGCCSQAVHNPEDEIQIVLRAVDNETDPMSIVNIFKFKQKRKRRTAELASYGIWGNSTNNLERLEFKGSRYGEKSYLLTINEFERDSEYGIIVTNPNALDEKSIIVSTFAIQ